MEPERKPAQALARKEEPQWCDTSSVAPRFVALAGKLIGPPDRIGAKILWNIGMVNAD